jgi:hypothetical protein
MGIDAAAMRSVGTATVDVRVTLSDPASVRSGGSRVMGFATSGTEGLVDLKDEAATFAWPSGTV